MQSETIVTAENHAEWLAARLSGIGASEVAAAIGVCPYRTPIELWQEKTSRVKPFAGNEATTWGTLLEPVILGEFERRENAKVIDRQMFVRHPGYPFLAATIDGRLEDGTIIEAKTTSGRSGGWGDEDDGDAVPEPYLVQTHAQMDCCGTDRAKVVVLIGGQRFRVYDIPRHETLIDLIRERAAEFWDCVVRDRPPEWGRMDAKALAVLNPECSGTIDLPPSVHLAVLMIDEANRVIKEQEELREVRKNAVLAAMGTAQYGRLPDGRVVKRFLSHTEACVKQVNYRASTRHGFRVLKEQA